MNTQGEKVRRTREVLHHMVHDMGGTVISTSGTNVGFSMHDGQGRYLYKLLTQGDLVFLEQVSGPEKGKKAEVATLSALLEAQAKQAS